MRGMQAMEKGDYLTGEGCKICVRVGHVTTANITNVPMCTEYEVRVGELAKWFQEYQNGTKMDVKIK